MLDELIAAMFGYAYIDDDDDTPIPLDGDFHYRCEACDVAGMGRACWSCDTDTHVTVGWRWGNGAAVYFPNEEAVAA